jgi:hypothetical protein
MPAARVERDLAWAVHRIGMFERFIVIVTLRQVIQ